MNLENLRKKFLKDEKLMDEIKKIYNEKFDLDGFTEHFVLDIDYDKSIQKELIFERYFKIKVTIRHYLNLSRNNEYFKKMSQKLIIPDHNDCETQVLKINDENNLLHLLLEYIILYNLLSNDSGIKMVTKKRPSQCPYCDNSFNENDLICSVCDEVIDDLPHNNVSVNKYNRLGQLRGPNEESIEDHLNNEQERSLEYSVIPSINVDNEVSKSNFLDNEDKRIKSNKDEKLTKDNDHIFYESDKVSRTCLFCNSLISMDDDKCYVCGADKLEQSLRDKDTKDLCNEKKEESLSYGKDNKNVSDNEEESFIKINNDLAMSEKIKGDNMLVKNGESESDCDEYNSKHDGWKVVEDDDLKTSKLCSFNKNITVKTSGSISLNERSGRMNDVTQSVEDVTKDDKEDIISEKEDSGSDCDSKHDGGKVVEDDDLKSSKLCSFNKNITVNTLVSRSLNERSERMKDVTECVEDVTECVEDVTKDDKEDIISEKKDSGSNHNEYESKYDERKVVEDNDVTVNDLWTCYRCLFAKNIVIEKFCKVCIIERMNGVTESAQDIPEETWKCHKCSNNNSFKINICVCKEKAPFFNKWVCEKCHYYNEKNKKDCYACSYKETKQKKWNLINKNKKSKNDWQCKSQSCKNVNEGKNKRCAKCGLKK